jgi:hypothetical protein
MEDNEVYDKQCRYVVCCLVLLQFINILTNKSLLLYLAVKI